MNNLKIELPREPKRSRFETRFWAIVIILDVVFVLIAVPVAAFRAGGAA
ncbi:hypothetical protein [Brucella intermedia]|nr:hypothetical protein [Brucella intermedia]